MSTSFFWNDSRTERKQQMKRMNEHIETSRIAKTIDAFITSTVHMLLRIMVTILFRLFICSIAQMMHQQVLGIVVSYKTSGHSQKSKS